MNNYYFYIHNNSRERLELLKNLIYKNIEVNDIEFSIKYNDEKKYWELSALVNDELYCLQLSIYANGVLDTLDYLRKIF